MSDINLSVNISKLLKEQAGGQLDFPDGSYISQAATAGIRLVCAAGYKKDWTNGANYYRNQNTEVCYYTDMQSNDPVDGLLLLSEFPIGCLWQTVEGGIFHSIGDLTTPGYTDWAELIPSTINIWNTASYASNTANDAQNIANSAQAAASSAQYTANTALSNASNAQSTADGKARGIEIKTADFTGVIGGRYIVESGNIVSITDPTGTTAGQSYEVWIGSGTIWFNGAGTVYSASRFSIRRRYNGSAWATPSPVIKDALTLGTPLSIGNGGFGATTEKDAVTNLTTQLDTAATSIALSAATHSGLILRCTAATAVTITVTGDLGAKFNCLVIQAGAGQITFVAAGGAAINSFGSALKTAGQHASASILRVAASTYNLSGNLTA